MNEYRIRTSIAVASSMLLVALFAPGANAGLVETPEAAAVLPPEVETFLPSTYELIGSFCPLAGPVAALPTGEEIFHFQDVDMWIIDRGAGGSTIGYYDELIFTVGPDTEWTCFGDFGITNHFDGWGLGVTEAE